LDPETRAVAAIDAALPYISSLGKELAKSVATAAGKSIWEWIKGRLTSASAKEAVEDLEKAPGDAANRKIAEGQLAKYLTSNPSALAELAQLLDKAGVTSATQTVTGNNNNVVQNTGSGDVTITSGPARTGRPPKGR
jgi:hypothetical protein